MITAAGSTSPLLGSVHVLFMFVVVCTGLRWLQWDCTAAANVHYELELYSGIYASICPPESCMLNSLRVDLCDCTSLYICMKVQS